MTNVLLMPYNILFEERIEIFIENSLISALALLRTFIRAGERSKVILSK